MLFLRSGVYGRPRAMLRPITDRLRLSEYTISTLSKSAARSDKICAVASKAGGIQSSCFTRPDMSWTDRSKMCRLGFSDKLSVSRTGPIPGDNSGFILARKEARGDRTSGSLLAPVIEALPLEGDVDKAGNSLFFVCALDGVSMPWPKEKSDILRLPEPSPADPGAEPGLLVVFTGLLSPLW